MSSEPKLASTAAIVLAGGKSSRMGTPKALLPFGGEPLIWRVVSRLNRWFGKCVVVAAPGQSLPELDAIVVRDAVAHQGPVGGIYYGLRETDSQPAFVTSCDAPFLNSRLIAHLVKRSEAFDVVVPEWQGRLQPLHAVYHPRVLPLLAAQLERGELRPIFLFDKVATLKIPETEIRRLDPQGRSFVNMNSPEDYQAALALLQEQGNAPSGDPAMSCTVELFGYARLLAKTAKISLNVREGATLKDVFSALADQLPHLRDKVIARKTNALAAGYACNLNGRIFVRDLGVEVHDGDSVFIVSADAGG